jgi:hypothetical protein
VALAVTRQGSHRPVRAHIRVYGSSADRFTIPEGSPWLFVRVLWTCLRTSMCSACFPRSSLPTDASLPSTGSSGASSPASTVLSKRYDLLPPIPPHFVAFVWRYLRVHSFFSLPGGRVRGRGLELLTRYLQPGFRRGNDRISQVLGEPQVSVRHVQSTPAGLRAPDHCGAAARPLVSEQQGLPRKVFRRSIASLSDSLSTLRSAGDPRPTQDSLPAVGQTLLDGLVTPRVPMRGLRVLSTSHPPLPNLPGAIGSTEASASLPARVGVVGPARAKRPDRATEVEQAPDRLSKDFCPPKDTSLEPIVGGPPNESFFWATRL